VKTTFTFAESPAYSLSGTTTEPKAVTRYEKAFSMNVSYFEHVVVFRQKIRFKAGEVSVRGTLEYMTCNDQKCLPPDDIDFTIPVN